MSEQQNDMSVQVKNMSEQQNDMSVQVKNMSEQQNDMSVQVKNMSEQLITVSKQVNDMSEQLNKVSEQVKKMKYKFSTPLILALLSIIVFVASIFWFGYCVLPKDTYNSSVYWFLPQFGLNTYLYNYVKDTYNSSVYWLLPVCITVYAVSLLAYSLYYKYLSIQYAEVEQTLKERNEQIKKAAERDNIDEFGVKTLERFNEFIKKKVSNIKGVIEKLDKEIAKLNPIVDISLSKQQIDVVNELVSKLNSNEKINPKQFEEWLEVLQKIKIEKASIADLETPKNPEPTIETEK